ncbi:MAG TPA: PPOX class F420-dependent oxidoreductase [Solirubrobacteraceae bacterium]|jgi:hypothetical protein
MSAARATAHPVPGRRLPAAIPGARLAARTAPKGARTITDVPRTGSIGDIRAHKRALVVTYRKDGTPVPTPVWAAEDGGCLYVRSERTCGKVKRLRKDPRVLIAPCTVRGKPLGPPFEATGRLLEPDEEPRAERVLASRYGPGRALFEWAMDRLRIDMGYLEITIDPWPSDAQVG